MFDIILKGGIVVDGTGKPPYKADVAVRKGRIAEIGMLNGAGERTKKVIDATDRFIMPGIVDIHSHADFTVHKADHIRTLKPLLMQGITTFVGGNCGAGLAPIDDRNLEAQRAYLEFFAGFDFDASVRWRSFAELLDHLEGQGVALNTALLAPHGVLRMAAMGLDQRAARSSEIARMRWSLEQALEEGAFGLSTGLQYPPGNQSRTDELVEVARPLGKQGGIYATHMRSYISPTVLRSLDEVIEIGRRISAPVQVSHILSAPYYGRFQPLFHKGVKWAAALYNHLPLPLPPDSVTEAVQGRLAAASGQGVQAGCDWMPTSTGFTHLFVTLPPWTYLGSYDEIMARLSSRRARRRIRRDVARWKCRWPHYTAKDWSINLIRICGYENLRIMSVVSEGNKSMEGRSIAELARLERKDPVDFICDLLLEEDGRVLIFESFTEPEDPFTEQFLHYWLDQDVSITTDTVLLGFGKPYPLFYGCFPRVLQRYVREQRILSLEEAVRRMTQLPASQAGIERRGEVRKSYYADLVVFDPMTITDHSSFRSVEHYPTGIDYVLVNGRPVVTPEGYDAGARAGKVLRRQSQ